MKKKMMNNNNKQHDLVLNCVITFIRLRKAKHGKIVDVRRPKTFTKAGYIPQHETALIIHGFNGTQTSQHIMYLKDGI